jgi:hypothetical protein
MAKPATKNVPAVKEQAAPPSDTAVPEYLRNKANKGVVGFRPEDLIIPRLDLMQDISPAVQEGEFRAGEFVHNVLEESFGKEVEVVIVLARKQYTLWRPRHDGDGGILARADDGVHWSPPDAQFEVQPHKGMKKKVIWRTAKTVEASKLSQWGSSDPDDPDSPPAANEMAVFVAIPVKRQSIGPVVFTLQRGSLTVGKKMIQRLMLSDVPMTGQIYRVSSERTTNASGDGFWTYKFTAAGFAPEELYAKAEAMQSRLLKMGFDIKGEDELVQDKDTGPTPGGKEYDV